MHKQVLEIYKKLAYLFRKILLPFKYIFIKEMNEKCPTLIALKVTTEARGIITYFEITLYFSVLSQLWFSSDFFSFLWFSIPLVGHPFYGCASQVT